MQTSWRPEFVTDSTSEAEVDAADEVAAARAASVVAEQPARLTMSRALRDLEAAKARVERDA
ncbi:MAG TPA: hypothetical protein VK427_14250, partial [Kofleriaceae bacterium]|nr:hypothetical protein [Kofleriaceae bacterium]